MNCEGTLQPGGSCTMNVTFTSTSGGTRSGAAFIKDNAPGSPQTVTVTNIGTATASFVSPFGFTMRGANPKDFGEQSSCGTSLAPNQAVRWR